MPKRTDIEKILIIGSGPIIIGQACEFDYSGTQACKSLKEDGYKIVLLNSNPATIMTDPDIADSTYIEPITVEILEKIIEKEKPDAVLPTLGGQTALNISVEAARRGIFEKHKVEMLGANVETIEKAENRLYFKKIMSEIGLGLPRSGYVRALDEALKIVETLGYPVIIRPSFTLGGSGGGIAYTESDLVEKVSHGLKISPLHEVLIEESVLGWKEYELEVMRDKKDNVVIVCSIENLDPMGVHTGDSITVAPVQTLSDSEYQSMRDAAIRAIRAIGVDTGGANVQFAINPSDGRMVIIEINPRVSRSSALASKATGFPIAKIAAKLAVGYTLDEIPNDITKKTPASFEPTLDYVVVKIPRFTFEKFEETDQTLGVQMKSVGEVMAIGRTFKEAIQKALRGLEIGRYGLGADGLGQVPLVEKLSKQSDKSLEKRAYIEQVRYKLRVPNCDRIFNIKYALQLGLSVEEIAELSKIDKWFICQIKEIVDLEKEVRSRKSEVRNKEFLKKLKQHGFSDYQIGYLTGLTEKDVRSLRKEIGLKPTYKLVDTCAAEFEAYTPYFYSTYEDEDEKLNHESEITGHKKIMILGGGPNRIGQGIEFDYCCVHCVFALRESGYQTVMVNCNPETVSTDYDTSDKLYFEPLTVEDVLNIVEREKVEGVIVQFGGQTPLNIAEGLAKAGVKIIGTQPESIAVAEDRKKFAEFAQRQGIKITKWGTAKTLEEAKEVAEKIGYPVMVRPSYVLGGRAMKIVYDDETLSDYLSIAGEISGGASVLIDQFLDDAIEIDVDAVCDGEDVYVCGIMEHIEEAGIHSGDSACVIPPYSLTQEIIDKIVKTTIKLAKGLNVIGLMNVQFAVKDNDLYVLEVNPRASRTVPFVSKATNIPVAKLATKVMIGRKLKELTKNHSTTLNQRYFSVKESVFPFIKFSDVDPVLGPEMRSTGEVMGIDTDFGLAFYKAQLAAGSALATSGSVLVSVSDKDKERIVPVVEKLLKLGFKIVATENTHKFLTARNINSQKVSKIGESKPDVVDVIKSGEIKLIINTPGGKKARRDGYFIRRSAYLHNIPIVTTVSGAIAAVYGIESLKNKKINVVSLQSR